MSDPWGVSPYEHAQALQKLNASVALHARSTALHIGIALFASHRASECPATSTCRFCSTPIEQSYGRWRHTEDFGMLTCDSEYRDENGRYRFAAPVVEGDTNA